MRLGGGELAAARLLYACASFEQKEARTGRAGRPTATLQPSRSWAPLSGWRRDSDLDSGSLIPTFGLLASDAWAAPTPMKAHIVSTMANRLEDLGAVYPRSFELIGVTVAVAVVLSDAARLPQAKRPATCKREYRRCEDAMKMPVNQATAAMTWLGLIISTCLIWLLGTGDD